MDRNCSQAAGKQRMLERPMLITFCGFRRRPCLRWMARCSLPGWIAWSRSMTICGRPCTGFWKHASQPWPYASVQRWSASGWCAAVAPSVRAKALLVAARLSFMQSDYDRNKALAQESLALFRELGDKRGIALALNRL